MKTQPLRACVTCLYMRARKSSDRQQMKQLRDSSSWCTRLGIPTEPHLFRCGGDDYSPAHPKAVALKLMEEHPDTNRQVLVWTDYLEWTLAYYNHAWFLSDDKNTTKLELGKVIGWCECPQAFQVDAGVEKLESN